MISSKNKCSDSASPKKHTYVPLFDIGYGTCILWLQLESSIQLKSQHTALDYETKYFHNFLGCGTCVSSCRRLLYFETQLEPILSAQDFAASSRAELYEICYAIIFVICA